ncbi:hypothetical protein M406DRAFT_104977 [Cryphonectria parasitica EP155]|uniref:catechol O-methyltransferase n=1 Tax=Cryphonectria parasitica (strain ATCC 38755 / EP155) TaxID=660469 RepID=A0A9P4YAP9_CRYP1|nr:uncharacterized protein M406DRAFT_104977 [Cryphonectria parasitica EP155]KAF3769555.1 hypothetical protein M406DRAFT_104977 [Cryphonectria parasitica EP155]
MDQQKKRHHGGEGSILERSKEQQQQLREHILSQPAGKYVGKPWDLIQDIEAFATEKRLPMIFKSAKIQTSKGVLAALDPKPKTVVEFGTFVGTSAIAWAAMLQEFNGADAQDIKVFTFEFDESVAAVARDIIKTAGLDKIIEVHVGPGSESLKKLHAEGRVQQGQLDVVFIDHWEKHYLPDLKLCEELKLFHAGSVALADNTDMPGAPDYLAYVKKGGDGPVKYESESLVSQNERGPSIVEASKIVAV